MLQQRSRLTLVVKNDNIARMTKEARAVEWIKAARKNFEGFPAEAQRDMARALTIVADGGYPDIAKPLTGFGSGVLELALKDRNGAFRIVYALQIGAEVWVIHAFQKKSKSGVSTPKAEIDLIRERLKRLMEVLR